MSNQSPQYDWRSHWLVWMAAALSDFPFDEVGTTDALEVLRAGLVHPDYEVRYQSVQALGHLDDPRAVRLLIETLQSDDERLRYWASVALGMQEATEADAIDAQIATLTDPNPYIRSTAAQVLGKLGNVRALPVLHRALSQNISPGDMADALAKIGTPAVPALLDVLSHTDRTLRFFAAGALSNIPNKRAIDPLVVALDDPAISVRWKAAEALLANGSAAVPGLINVLGHEHARVRRAAAELLGKLGDQSAVPVLERLARQETDADVRDTALEALRMLL